MFSSRSANKPLNSLNLGLWVSNVLEGSALRGIWRRQGGNSERGSIHDMLEEPGQEQLRRGVAIRTHTHAVSGITYHYFPFLCMILLYFSVAPESTWFPRTLFPWSKTLWTLIQGWDSSRRQQSSTPDTYTL